MQKKYFTIYRQITACIICILLWQQQSAAQVLPCGESKIDKAALKKALDFENTHKAAPLTGNYVIRVYLHNVGYTDGSNLTATTDQLNAEFKTLVADYSGDNICFVLAGINNIYDTRADTALIGSNNSTTRLFLTPYNVPNCINIFYVKQIGGTNTACAGSCGFGGYTFSIPDTMTVIAKGNIGVGQTISHETGHILGLYHTFENFGGTSYEDIDGSNSSTTADFITDTKADPYAYKGQSCYSATADSCTYNGSCTDPKGQKNFTPPYSNLMAYWWRFGCYANLAFTTGQYTRINSFLNTNAPLIRCLSPSFVTEGPNLTISAGYFMASAINTLSTSGAVNFSGTGEVTLGGQLVALEAGFHAFPSTGKISIEPVTCVGSTFAGFTQNNFNTIISNNSAVIKQDLFVYPNPAKNTANISFILTNNESNVLLQLFNMSSQKVKQVEWHNMLPGKQTVTLDLHNYSQGVYYAVVTIGNKTFTTKIVVLQ